MASVASMASCLAFYAILASGMASRMASGREDGETEGGRDGE
jgi:hypothetical protein